MKCSDIQDRPILEFLKERHDSGKTWCCWYQGYENSISPTSFEGCPDKIIIRKMAQLIKRDLVSGCPCGCRGDYEITQKGIDFLTPQDPSVLDNKE